ncbi:MAG TPA: hypothetical protein DCS93_41415 [Microscillaceae bacterium]|nr:hypothetical protein [Microscillaceae bacterium]
MQQQINTASEKVNQGNTHQNNTQISRKTSQKSPYTTREGKLGAIQAKQRLVNKSQLESRTIDPFKVVPNAALKAHHQNMEASYAEAIPIQRQKEKNDKSQPQGSAKFKEIATAMGEQHGVDTSALKATHNSSFPATVNAAATIQGNKIDFAPGQDSEHTMKHEVAHYIDNAKNGVPSGDKLVNGQRVDTTREKVVDKMAEGTLQRKEGSPNVTQALSEDNVVQRVRPLGGAGSNDMTQQAGTCGIYSLANGIAVAHNRLADAQYRTDAKDKLLRIAGQQNAHVTAQGELVTFEDVQTLIDAYNADQNNDPTDRVRIVRREAPGGANAQDWRDTLGRSTNRNFVQKLFGFGHRSENEVNQQQAGAIIAVDWTILSNYADDPGNYDERDVIPRSDNSSGAHWVTIVHIQGNNVRLHNSHDDMTSDYPIWVLKQATDRLQDVDKDDYLNSVYDETDAGLGVGNDSAGFAEANTRDWGDVGGGYPDQANRDYQTMLNEPNVNNQRHAITGRLDQTVQNPGAHGVRLRNLIIRIRPA